MKILYHHRVASRDGQYVHIEELVRALRARGHEVIVVGPEPEEQREFGADHRLVDGLKRHLPKALYELLELGYSGLAWWRLRRAVRRHRPDCLYERYNLYLPAGVWLRRRFRLPMLLEVNAPLFAERTQHSGGLALPALARWSERYCWRGADRVLTVTRVLGDMVAAEGVPDERIRVIANGVDRDRFGDVGDRGGLRARLGLGDRLVLGFTGFVREWHGLERAVDVVARAPDRHLLLVGDGPARAGIEAHARALGVADRVTVTGVVPRPEVAAHVACFDVALQPDVVAYASPLKLIEYLAMGCAIVAPDRANIRELIEHAGNGWLFDADDPAAFTSAVETLCRDPALRGRLGAAARATIDERGLTWERNAATVEGLFRELGVGAEAPAAVSAPQAGRAQARRP